MRDRRDVYRLLHIGKEHWGTSRLSPHFDASSLVDETSRQIRTISHLLHPPLLEEVELRSALRWYVEGFSNRSKIPVMLEVDKDVGRYDPNVEIAVFRILQECLTNIHRYAANSKALVKLSGGEQGLEIAVQDNGKGIPADKLQGLNPGLGIGLLGMKQRVSQLGGELEINSSTEGTTVTARLPVQPVASHLKRGSAPSTVTSAILK